MEDSASGGGVQVAGGQQGRRLKRKVGWIMGGKD